MKLSEKGVREYKMTKRLNQKGFSTVEVLCISFLTIVAVLFIIWGFFWYRDNTHKTEDKVITNTAESVANADLVSGSCVVRGCGGGDNCTHKTQEGYVGYFDHPSNSIKGEPGKGYNQYKEMTIGDKTYYGAPNTMVIKIVANDGILTLSWVKGDN